MQRRCSICADVIAAEDLHQHLTGDYHKACYASIAAAALHVEHASGDGARCHLCNDSIAQRAVVVTPGSLVVHLRCFFDPESAGGLERLR
jgi:hypothetical protein